MSLRRYKSQIPDTASKRGLGVAGDRRIESRLSGLEYLILRASKLSIMAVTALGMSNPTATIR